MIAQLGGMRPPRSSPKPLLPGDVTVYPEAVASPGAAIRRASHWHHSKRSEGSVEAMVAASAAAAASRQPSLTCDGTPPPRQRGSLCRRRRRRRQAFSTTDDSARTIAVGCSRLSQSSPASNFQTVYPHSISDATVRSTLLCTFVHSTLFSWWRSSKTDSFEAESRLLKRASLAIGH